MKIKYSPSANFLEKVDFGNTGWFMPLFLIALYHSHELFNMSFEAYPVGWLLYTALLMFLGDRFVFIFQYVRNDVKLQAIFQNHLHQFWRVNQKWFAQALAKEIKDGTLQPDAADGLLYYLVLRFRNSKVSHEHHGAKVLINEFIPYKELLLRTIRELRNNGAKVEDVMTFIRVNEHLSVEEPKVTEERLEYIKTMSLGVVAEHLKQPNNNQHVTQLISK